MSGHVFWAQKVVNLNYILYTMRFVSLFDQNNAKQENLILLCVAMYLLYYWYILLSYMYLIWFFFLICRHENSVYYICFILWYNNVFYFELHMVGDHNPFSAWSLFRQLIPALPNLKPILCKKKSTIHWYGLIKIHC